MADVGQKVEQICFYFDCLVFAEEFPPNTFT